MRHEEIVMKLRAALPSDLSAQESAKFEEFCEWIKDPDNAERCMLSENFVGDLADAFYWLKTPQGHAFWEGLQERRANE